MVQIHAHTHAALMMLIQYQFFFLVLCVVKAPAFASHCCYSFWASVCFAIVSLLLCAMHHFLPLLFSNFRFVAIQNGWPKSERARTMHAFHSIELNEMCVVGIFFFLLFGCMFILRLLADVQMYWREESRAIAERSMFDDDDGGDDDCWRLSGVGIRIISCLFHSTWNSWWDLEPDRCRD